MENYSLNSKGIKQAATELINDNTTHLIQYIYRQAGILEEESTDFVTIDKDENDIPENRNETVPSIKNPINEKTKDLEQPKVLEKTKDIEKTKDNEKTKDLEKAKVAVTKDEKQAKNSIFQNVEVRIGLSIRILAKTNRYYDEELINLILDDIDYLRKDSDYLLSFKDPKARRVALDEEYALVQGYIDMDDTISLNQDIDTVSRVGKLASDSQCVIQ